MDPFATIWNTAYICTCSVRSQCGTSANPDPAAIFGIRFKPHMECNLQTPKYALTKHSSWCVPVPASDGRKGSARKGTDQHAVGRALAALPTDWAVRRRNPDCWMQGGESMMRSCRTGEVRQGRGGVGWEMEGVAKYWDRVYSSYLTLHIRILHKKGNGQEKANG